MAQDNPPEARIFPVDTRFQQMARRPGGVTRDKAISHAQAGIEEIKPQFDSWLDHKIQELTNIVPRSQSAVAASDWRERAATHSMQMRDLGTTMGFPLISSIANTLCEIFDAIDAGAECNLNAIRCHVDALQLGRQKGYRNLPPEKILELTRGLQRVAERVSNSQDSSTD